MIDWNYLLHAIRNQQQQRNGNKRIFHVLPPLFEKCFIYGNDPEQSNLIVTEYCTQYVKKKTRKKNRATITTKECSIRLYSSVRRILNEKWLPVTYCNAKYSRITFANISTIDIGIDKNQCGDIHRREIVIHAHRAHSVHTHTAYAGNFRWTSRESRISTVGRRTKEDR